MRRYVIKRLAQAVGVLWAAYTVSFLVLDFLPGDPVSAMAGAGMDSGQVDPAQLAALRHEYGFDKPVLAQYAEYLGRAVRGDFGDVRFTERTRGSELFVNPLMALYFCVDLPALARANLYLGRLEDTVLMRQISTAVAAFRDEVPRQRITTG